MQLPKALATVAPSAEAPPWPDGIDATLTAAYLAVIFGIPLLGHVLMVIDFRRYLRSLRRALIVIGNAFPAPTPAWAQRKRPRCLDALDLELPCTEEEVLAAYRERAKLMHPDRGGDLQKFLRLQRHFEQAMDLARRAASR